MMTDQPSSPSRLLIALAWAIMLCVSVLPNALLHELAGSAPAWLLWAKIGLLITLAVITFFWPGLRPLRNFFLILLAILLALGYRRANFFLVRGKLDAPITPVRWLGFPKPDPWARFGGQFSIYIGVGLLVFLIIGGRSSWASFVRAAPMLPAVLLFAAMNACGEKMTLGRPFVAGC